MICAVFGDTHGNINLMFEKAQAWEDRTGISIDVVIQVGDFGVWPNPESVDPASRKHAIKEGLPPAGDFISYAKGEARVTKPLYFIRGNHEDQLFLRAYERIQQALYPEDYLTRTIEICPGMHYIPDGHIVKIGDASFGAWGGNFAKKTWERGLEYWAPELNGRRLNHMTRDVFERLIREKFDVLLTHDAPIGSGVVGAVGIKLPEEEMTGAGCVPIKELIDVVQPRYQFGGHWHEFHHNKFGRTDAFVLDKVAPLCPDARCMEVIEL